MHGVKPGTEFGRYTLTARIETVSGGERWAARDATLERAVTLLIMPADADATAVALDAARRAASVEAAQLVRILDVGTHESLAYVSEEYVDGSTTLAQAIGTRGLPAEEVRRVSGEVATGLEAARSRGLHHLTLTPDTVLLTPDARVKVRGLATTAALAGIETEGEEADRDDATGVVALAYAGLTATWPLEVQSTLAPARRGSEGPMPPSRVAVGVPGDLDTICRETLTEGTGPDSPGDYAAQIAPWSRIPLAGAMHAASAATEGTEGTEAPQQSAAAAHAESDDADVSDDDVDTNEIPVYRDGDQSPSDGAAADGAPDGGTAGTGASGRSAGAAAAAVGTVGAGAKVVGDRLGKASKTAADRSRDALQDARARRAAIREDRTRHSSLGAAPVSGDVEPPAPLLPPEAGRAPTREQSNLVLMIVAGFVALACIIGAVGTSRIGDGSELGDIFTDGGSTAGSAPSTSTAEPSPSSSEPAEEEDSGSNEPYAVLNAAGYDPVPGDGVEHNAEAQRVYDGDDETAWTTEGYNSTDFGGLKQGVGITIDLGQAQEISSVRLVLPSAASATVYAGEQPTSSGTQIGSTEGRTGEVTLEASDPVSGRYVTVWFTSLASDGQGRYRATLGEITVR